MLLTEVTFIPIYLSVLILSPITPFSPHISDSDYLQSILVAQDAFVFSCATMVFIHIIQAQDGTNVRGVRTVAPDLWDVNS